MKVFITGGTGFIGSHIVVELLAKGDEVTILARDPNKIPLFQEMPGIAFVRGGLDNQDLLEHSMQHHDACIHNALYWGGLSTELELRDTRAAAMVFHAASRAGVKHLIYTSSTAVHRPFQPVMDETMRIAPNDLYGATKAAAEAFLSAFSHQTEMRCNTIRPGPTIGSPVIAGAPTVCDRRFTTMIDAALIGEEIRVSEDEGRQFIDAVDLAKIYSAVLHSDVSRQVYIGLSENITPWKWIANDIIALSGSQSKVVVGSEEILPFRFDVEKIKREFGLEFNSQAGMERHLRHLLVRPTANPLVAPATKEV